MKISRFCTFSVAAEYFAVVNCNAKSPENIEMMTPNHNKSIDSFNSSSYTSEKHYIHVFSTICRAVTGRYYFTQFAVKIHSHLLPHGTLQGSLLIYLECPRSISGVSGKIHRPPILVPGLYRPALLIRIKRATCVYCGPLPLN